VHIEHGLVTKTRVIDNRPPSGPAAGHYKRGRAWQLAGNYQKSITAFGEAVRLHPEYADAYYARGLAYESIGDYDRSLADFQKVLQLEPGAIFLFEACNMARKTIDKEIARVLNCRGAAFLQKGEYEMAVADFTESLERDPKPSVQFARGRAYYALHRFKEAIDDLLEFARTNPKDEQVCFDIYYRLGDCYREIRSYKQAIFNAGIAIRFDPNNPDGYFVRGSAYFENGEHDKAVKDMTEAGRLGGGAYLARARESGLAP
jgi:tetratricopeptide (TPR) repeat protein